MQADIIKQKQPVCDGGYKALNKQASYGKFSEKMYTDLNSEHPIDLTRYQVVNNYMGRIGLINSGGASGKDDLAQVVKTAVINKRAGGIGLITGRKAFQKPMKKGVELFHALSQIAKDPPAPDLHQFPPAQSLVDISRRNGCAGIHRLFTFRFECAKILST